MSALIKKTKISKKKLVQTPMTVGEKLAMARSKKGLGFLEIEQKTLIRAKYLEALEQSKFYELPLPVYTFGFVQTYATFLGLNATRVLQQFRSEFGNANKASVGQLALHKNVENDRVIVTPRLMWRAFSASLVVGIVAYIGFQVASFAGVPLLQIDSPAQGTEVSSNTLTVAGVTDPGVAVFIGQQRIQVSEDGHFVQSDIHADQGVLTLSIKAVGRSGKTKTVTRVVKVNAPATALGEIQGAAQ